MTTQLFKIGKFSLLILLLLMLVAEMLGIVDQLYPWRLEIFGITTILSFVFIFGFISQIIQENKRHIDNTK